MLCFITTVFILLGKSAFDPVHGANILGLMATPSPSHHIWNSALMHRLAEKGHNVTVLSVDLPKSHEKLPPNLHYIHLEEGYGMYTVAENKLDMNFYIGVGPFEMIPLYHKYGYDACFYAFKSKGIQVLLNYPNEFKFDLIVHDYTVHYCLLGFVHRFKYPPVVGVSAYPYPDNTIDAMSNHYFPAYVPHHLIARGPEMNFWERMENTLLYIYETVLRRFVLLPRSNAVMKSYFPKGTPSLEELILNTTICLINSHPSIHFLQSLPPNVIEVGGLQILDPRPLPKDLEEFMNKSRNGVILVSFGTNMKSEFVSKKQIDVIVNATSQLPQYDFLWKFDEDFLIQKLPANVLIKSFLPQNDLLAHPNLKAFVTHSGGLSTQESIWRGVPMIGVPLFVDQHNNIHLAVRAGIARKVDYLTMTASDLRDAIKTVAEDPTIRENVKKIARNYQDRPMKPLDTAVWWVEYLLRNPNPAHLKSPAGKLNIFQANSLDCLLVLCAVCVAIVYLGVKLLSLAWKTINEKKAHTATKQKVN